MSAKVINYNSIENFTPLVSAINKKHNIYEKRHLERDGNSVKVVSDGFIDADKEIQNELKNAGLQNILKLQELRYGTIDNAIARAKDKGIYADVSEIPTSVAGQAEFVAAAQAKMAKLKAELGLTDDELASLNYEKLLVIYQNKAAQEAAAASQSNNEGGNE